jgi:Flp pilus assembly protein TadB
MTAALCSVLIVVLAFAGGGSSRAASRLRAPRRWRVAERTPHTSPVVSVSSAIATLSNRRRLAIRPAAVAAWVDDLSRSLRHGATLHESLTTIVPRDRIVARATDELRHRLARGASVGGASDGWDASLETDPTPRVELLRTTASVISVCATLGGPGAAPLDRLAVALRQQFSDDLERAAQSAQARISAFVLTIIPVAVLALLITTDAHVRAALVEPAGAAAVSVGLVFNVVGAFWMHHIVGRLS